MELVYISDYFAYRPGPSGKTLVNFSGISASARKFYSVKALTKSKHNLVFINCKKNSWYLDGVPGLGDSFRSAAAELKRFLEEKGWFEDSVYWGGSMGGFGATLYGALHDSSNIVTCGAEWKLGISNSNSRKILCNIQKKNIPEYPDIPQIVKNSKSNIRTYWGDFAYHDFAAFSPKDFQQNVKFLTLKEYGHPLPVMIHQNYGLEAFIDHHLDSPELFPFPESQIGDLLFKEDLARDLHITANNGYEIHSEPHLEAIKRLQVSSEISENQRVHTLHALGCHHNNRGQYDSALEAFDEAIAMTPHNTYPFLNYHAAIAAKGLNKADRVIGYLQDSPICYLQTNFEHSEKACELLIAALLKSKGLEQAEKFYNKLIKKDEKIGSSEGIKDIFIEYNSNSRKRKITIDFEGICKLDRDTVIIDSENQILITGIALSSSNLAISHAKIHLDNADIKEESYNLKSPGLAKVKPDNKLSIHSRFKLVIKLKKQLAIRIDLFSTQTSEIIGNINITI